MSGKGSRQRPAQISQAELAERWEETFRKGQPRLRRRRKPGREEPLILEWQTVELWDGRGFGGPPD